MQKIIRPYLLSLIIAVTAQTAARAQDGTHIEVLDPEPTITRIVYVKLPAKHKHYGIGHLIGAPFRALREANRLLNLEAAYIYYPREYWMCPREGGW